MYLSDRGANHSRYLRGTTLGAHAVSTLGGSRSRVQRDRLGPGPSADAGPPQASMPPLQHIRFSPDWHAAQPQRAIVSCDTINRAHVRGRATQSGSARTWRLQGSSGGWSRRSAAREGRAVESSWRQRCRTWPDHVGAILWREPRLSWYRRVTQKNRWRNKQSKSKNS